MLSEDRFFLGAKRTFRQPKECLADCDRPKLQISFGFFTGQRRVDPCLEVGLVLAQLRKCQNLMRIQVRFDCIGDVAVQDPLTHLRQQPRSLVGLGDHLEMPRLHP